MVRRMNLMHNVCTKMCSLNPCYRVSL